MKIKIISISSNGKYIKQKQPVVELPVVFVEPAPVNLVAEELCSTGKLWTQ